MNVYECVAEVSVNIKLCDLSRKCFVNVRYDSMEMLYTQKMYFSFHFHIQIDIFNDF